MKFVLDLGNFLGGMFFVKVFMIVYCLHFYNLPALENSVEQLDQCVEGNAEK